MICRSIWSRSPARLASHAITSCACFAIRSIRHHQYLVQRRIERAKLLLAAGDLNITEVCYAVGFQSLGSFSALFHRCAGYAPKEYRARLFRGMLLPRRFVPACFLRMLDIAVPACR